MASPPPPFQVEDQTDEDFFDNLVDDELGTAGSGSNAGEMARAFSNLSISEMGVSEGSGVHCEAEDLHESSIEKSFEVPEKEIGVTEESISFISSNPDIIDDVGPSGDPSEVLPEEVRSPDSYTGKSISSKGTSVKEVQWSAFSVDSSQLDAGGFESFPDFTTEVPDWSADKQAVVPDPNGGLKENSFSDQSTYPLEQQDGTSLTSSEQYHSQLVNEENTGGNDLQNWDNSYPGWKYDASTGQWYQVDGYYSTADAQLDSYSAAAAVNPIESIQDKPHSLGDGVVVDQRSDFSHLQQAAQSAVETVTEGFATGSVSSWNQVSQGTIEYPPNMVFDPQYPGYYYDMNTQQWYSLESYSQTIHSAAGTFQNELTPNAFASSDGFSGQNYSLYPDEFGQFGNQTVQAQNNQELGRGGGGSMSNYSQQSMWQPDTVNKSGTVAGFSGNQQMGSFYGSMGHDGNVTASFKATETVSNDSYKNSNGTAAFQGFIPAESAYQFNQPMAELSQQANLSHNYYDNQNSINYSQQSYQSGNASFSQFSYVPNEGRSSAGRPRHALVTFGFGGKLIVMKDPATFSSTNVANGSLDNVGSTVSIINLMEITVENASSIENHNCDYFNTLCKQSFPGPLVGGGATTKDLNKWIDERITSYQPSTMDFRKGELLRLLLSLLKISCQHYGKLRSPFGTDPLSQETDGPESAVTKLFASARKDDARLRQYGSFTHCMHTLPSEGHIQTTAVEVQNLLVSGKRKEALQTAQEGQLWGPALVLAAQLGEKFYVDTVKQMAHRQFVCGSPLRTLCLLIAGQPADVFSAQSCTSSSSGAVNILQQPSQVLPNGMLDDWEENLAIITANRTKDDELVIIHLGDCLWKEKGDITAAHTCYLVAEANFESYSDTARLCLIGADHWKCPRTYASPEAIQRTELYEYSKVLGNSQFILLPFQPYKLIYAYMLAEVGKVSDSLRYCQAISKSLKNSSRAPDVETWKMLASSLEERLRAHQQGGYSTNLAPAKLVGKLFTSIDRSIHRMMGTPPLPPLPQNSAYINEHDSTAMPAKVANSQSTMAMSSLVPSASVEMMNEWAGDTRRTMHNRSISEPDFGRSSKEINASKDASSIDGQNKTSISGGPSRFGRFGSQLLQKTMGWVAKSRPDRQAKLGETNRFYYDEKLKRWVEEGVEPPVEETALPPPPTTALFQNGFSGYNVNDALKSQSLPVPANGGPETKSSTLIEHSSGIPPIPPSPNQFSARGRMGVRSRYVDTFNKGGGAPASSFQSPPVPSVKPMGGANFFVPTPAASNEPTSDATESIQAASSNEDASTSVVKESSFSSLSSVSSTPTMSRYPSMDNITPLRNKGMTGPALQNGNGSLSSRTRASSWSGGSFPDMFTPKMTEVKPLGDRLGSPSPPSFTPSNPSPMGPGSGISINGGGFGDDLHEVEL